MYEVEVKVPTPLERVRHRLDDIDADLLDTVRQLDTYYDHPVRDFGETDEALRLRRETPTSGSSAGTPVDDPTDEVETDEVATLTYKGPRVDDRSKTRQEVETRVDGPDATDSLLRSIGFTPAAVVEKDRTRFRVNGFTVALDRVEGLGTFVEVEAEGEAGEVDALRMEVLDLCQRLDLEVDTAVQSSYLALQLREE